MKVFQHADGDYCVISGSHAMIVNGGGNSVPAIIYRAINYNVETGSWMHKDGPLYVTTADRWADRFKEVTHG